MTTIRDINGNRLTKTHRHLANNTANIGHWHQDSTGLFCIDYTDAKGDTFCAFVRPETATEKNTVAIAKKHGTPRPD